MDMPGFVSDLSNAIISSALYDNSTLFGLYIPKLTVQFKIVLQRVLF